MSTERVSRVVIAFGATVALLVFVPTSVAHADVVNPAGACVGSGTWQQAGISETSTSHSSDDVIEVPQADTVKWSGNQAGYQLGAEGPERPISGEVQLDLPVGTVTIDDWGNNSVRYANEGEHKYDLPSVLVGIKMRLHGEHRENGKVTCSGAVYVQVKGSAMENPLTWGALAGLVVSGGALLFAGKPVFKKVAPAFEDINPG